MYLFFYIYNMCMEINNLNSIKSISIIEPEINNNYNWVKGFKRAFSKVESGYYPTTDIYYNAEDRKTKSDIENIKCQITGNSKYFIKENKVYNKHNVCIKHMDGNIDRLHFDTYENCEKYISSLNLPSTFINLFEQFNN